MAVVPGGSSASSRSVLGGAVGSAVSDAGPEKPKASSWAGSCWTGPSCGQATSACAVPISRLARSFGVSVKVS